MEPYTFDMVCQVNEASLPQLGTPMIKEPKPMLLVELTGFSHVNSRVIFEKKPFATVTSFIKLLNSETSDKIESNIEITSPGNKSVMNSSSLQSPSHQKP